MWEKEEEEEKENDVFNNLLGIWAANVADFADEAQNAENDKKVKITETEQKRRFFYMRDEMKRRFDDIDKKVNSNTREIWVLSWWCTIKIGILDLQNCLWLFHSYSVRETRALRFQQQGMLMTLMVLQRIGLLGNSEDIKFFTFYIHKKRIYQLFWGMHCFKCFYDVFNVIYFLSIVSSLFFFLFKSYYFIR